MGSISDAILGAGALRSESARIAARDRLRQLRAIPQEELTDDDVEVIAALEKLLAGTAQEE